MKLLCRLVSVVGSCRQKRQLLRQKIIDEQQRLLGGKTVQHKHDAKEHDTSKSIADDDSLLISDAETGLHQHACFINDVTYN